jgi:hypothetical protein
VTVDEPIHGQHAIEVLGNYSLIFSFCEERPMLRAACHARGVSIFCVTQVQHGDDDRLHVLNETFLRSSGEVWVTGEYEHLWCLVGELTGAPVQVVVR